MPDSDHPKTDYRKLAYQEASERAARYGDALSMSRTRVVGDSLPDTTPPILDRRTCGRCGSLYGKCPHTKGLEDNYVKTVKVPHDNTRPIEHPMKGVVLERWTKGEVAEIKRLHRLGVGPTAIGNMMGRSKGSVIAKLSRMRAKAEKAAGG